MMDHKDEKYEDGIPERLLLLSMQYAFLSVAHKSNHPSIKSTIDEIAFWPKRVIYVEKFLTQKQLNIYKECMYIDDFGSWSQNSFEEYIKNLKERVFVELEKEITFKNWKKFLTNES